MSSDSSYFENELKSFSLPGASVKFPEDIWFYGIGAPCTPWSKFSAQIVRNGYVNCSTLFHCSPGLTNKFTRVLETSVLVSLCSDIS